MRMQANARCVPSFRKELNGLLSREGIPLNVVDRVLEPLDRLVDDPNTGSTTSPYVAGNIAFEIRRYNENLNATDSRQQSIN